MFLLNVRVPAWPASPLAWAMLAALQALPGRAQVADPADGPLLLKASPLLQELLPADQRGQLPTFVRGDRVAGRPDLDTLVEGNATLRRGDTVIHADRLSYYQPDDLASARGHVRINRAGNVFEGPLLELKMDAFEGYFLQPSYQFLSNAAHGEADRVDFIDESRAVIRNATFTTCQRVPGPSWLPDWVLRATLLRMDTEEDVGQAEGALLSFKGIPLLPVPYLSFPLSGQRKSGFLPPTFGLDNLNGVEVTLPYYWNIAPNRDATFYPLLMSKRGINVGSQFRYLESAYTGQVRLDVMPVDALRDVARWGLSASHQGTFDLPLTGRVALSLGLNRVSDDNYWRDFSTASSTGSLTQRLLANDLALSWSSGSFSNSIRALKWQTLQDVGSPIVPPYDRLPQLSTRYAHTTGQGLEVSLDADYTRFQSDRVLTGQVNAERTYALAQISRTWSGAAGYFKPKLQLHTSHYQFDGALTNGATAASRLVPTLSLDSGVVFERDASFFGRALRQTLEPRAFYVNTPYRDQSLLPNYDSGATDFNFATVYTENAYVGQDRISDSNLLTLGVTSRLLDPDTGAEAARFVLAQRLRFKDQNVVLPGAAVVSDRFSDVLLAGAVNWDPKWTLDANLQYNPKIRQSERSTLGARYSPGDYRVVSAAYRYQRDSSQQIDVGWQWPINDLWGDRGQVLGSGMGQGPGRWYSVGRINYSMRDRKVVDSVLGFEYDAGCWLGRIVMERLQTSTSSANARIMAQLEFVGFSRLGISPLKSLKDNIPRYQYLREQTTTPSRFSHYD